MVFFLVNSLSKQNRAMRRCMKKPHSLKLRQYDVCLFDLNEYLDSFPGATMSDNMGVTELITILLKIMTNVWSKQAYVQVFDYENIPFKKSVDIFENMEISESIYEGVVPPSY